MSDDNNADRRLDDFELAANRAIEGYEVRAARWEIGAGLLFAIWAIVGTFFFADPGNAIYLLVAGIWVFLGRFHITQARLRRERADMRTVKEAEYRRSRRARWDEM